MRIKTLFSLVCIAAAMVIPAVMPHAAAAAPFKVTITVFGSGKGDVSGQGISCETPKPGGAHDCTGTYQNDSSVTLHADAGRHAKFKGWSGDLSTCATNNDCTFTISNRDVVGGAKFKQKRH